jgi:tetratricopeptide (TPR) repeat protein
LADSAAWMAGKREPTADPTDPTSTLHASFALMQAGDNAAAERLVDWALAFTPDHPGLLRRRSDAALSRGDAAAAEGWTRKALAADATEADSHAQLATLLARRGAREEAVAALRQALACAPARAGFHARLGGLLFDAGDWDAAEDAYRRAVEHAATPAQSAPWLVRLSEIGIRRGDVAAALDWARRAVAAGPAAHHHLAWLHFSHGNLPAAHESMARAVALAPQNGGMLRLMSDIRMRLGDHAGALDWARRVTAANPRDAGSHHHEAAIHIAGGALTLAAAAARRAHELEPGNADFARRLAYTEAMVAAEAEAAPIVAAAVGLSSHAAP